MNALRTIAEAGISATKGAVSPENQRAALLAVTEKGQELAKAAPGAASQASSRPSHQTMPTSFGPPPSSPGGSSKRRTYHAKGPSTLVDVAAWYARHYMPRREAD